MKIDDNIFKSIVESSYSIRQVILKSGLIPAGGNYVTIKNRIAALDLDSSHFRGQGWLKGLKKPYGNPRTKALKEIFDTYENYPSHRLKNRLFKEGLKQKKCNMCGLSMWNGDAIALELHHLDGDKKNNNLSNLQILCPNCHATTNNYRGKGVKTKYETLCSDCSKPIQHSSLRCISCVKESKKPTPVCSKCGKQVSKKSSLCRSCYNDKEKLKSNKPLFEVLKKDIEELNYTGAGKKYGVSDNTIRKWLISYKPG